jgi:hypothetical protein
VDQGVKREEVPRIYWKPADKGSDACLVIEVNGAKRYRRFWNPGTDQEKIEWGWVLPTTAIEMKADDA